MSRNGVLKRLAEGQPAEVVAYAAAMMADPCAYCPQPSEALDHIVPLARGGSDDWQNLTGICGRCNSEKRTATPLGLLAARMYRAEREMAETVLVYVRGFRAVGV